MKKYILLFITTFLLANPLQNELKHLTYHQKYVMIQTYLKAKKFNLGYTMAAIAWQESKFGKYNINLSDPSCGYMHIMPKYETNDKWKQSRICERLIKDMDFSLSLAIARFKYFYNYWRSKGYNKKLSWKYAIMSYNSGFNIKRGKSYYRKIKIKIIYLRKYLKRYIK